MKSEQPRIEDLQSVAPGRAVKRPRVAVQEPARTRIEVVSGRRKTVLNWYAGAKSDDIRAAISRRFGIDESRWFLNNADNEHVVLSHGIPSGRYHLVPFDEIQTQPQVTSQPQPSPVATVTGTTPLASAAQQTQPQQLLHN